MGENVVSKVKDSNKLGLEVRSVLPAKAKSFFTVK
jgi:hypothetical protein